MNWIVASILMFVSSVALYLMVRKSSLAKNPSQYNNMAMFLIPFFFFVVMGISTNQNFVLPPAQFAIITFIAILFSYLGNLFSLKSIEYAPNPGYSLVISKSYVVFTTIISVLFLGSELSFRKSLAILFIVLFSGLIMLSQKSLDKTVNKLWLPLAFGSFFCWSLLSLSSRYLFDQGLNIFVFLTYMYLIVSLCILIEMYRKKVPFKLERNNFWIFMSIGVFSMAFNLFQFQAIAVAPNVGYVNAINASSISAVTVLAIILIKDEFSKRKLVGVIGVTFGLLLLLI